MVVIDGKFVGCVFSIVFVLYVWGFILFFILLMFIDFFLLVRCCVRCWS